MNPFATLSQLYFESKSYSKTGGKEHWKIFFLLVYLYFKSKTSNKNLPEINCKIDGLHFSAYDYPSFINLYKEIFLEKIYGFDSNHDHPLIIDCGSNIGMSLLFFKKLYPKSTILAFEPNPKSAELIQKNIRTNQLTGIELFQYALSNHEGKSDFYYTNKHGNINSTTNKPLNYGSKIEIQSKLLSNFVKGKSVDLIKIDIEGDEIKVIEDLKNHGLISNSKEYIIEFHEKTSLPENSFSKFLSIFEEEGYFLKIIKTDIEEEKGKNILLHFSKK